MDKPADQFFDALQDQDGENDFDATRCIALYEAAIRERNEARAESARNVHDWQSTSIELGQERAKSAKLEKERDDARALQSKFFSNCIKLQHESTAKLVNSIHETIDEARFPGACIEKIAELCRAFTAQHTPVLSKQEFDERSVRRAGRELVDEHNPHLSTGAREAMAEFYVDGAKWMFDKLSTHTKSGSEE